MNPSYYIEKLIQFGLHNNIIEIWDIPFVRNQIMDILNITEPYGQEVDDVISPNPMDILTPLLSHAVSVGIIQDNTTERDLLDSKIMGALMPRPSELVKRFREIEEKDGIKAATDYFYKLSIDSNYIRMDRISKNIMWLSPTVYGDLQITINLSKPEKDPKEIEASKHAPQLDYPKCLLCLENVGYPGRLNHPGRSNHRVIPVTLAQENWYLQYSPYVYYNEHAIVFSETHRPMTISQATFERCLDFIDRYPHYFIGSNADLPIVGGSILSHDHFQGGRHHFPMEDAEVLRVYRSDKYPDVEVCMLKWPLSVIRLVSNNRNQLCDFATHILSLWRSYTDEEVAIFAYSGDIPHNTVTPIARKNKSGSYELDIALRNNRTDDRHPLGVFHPHAHLHHIKKENIGLIEVMGLAILPSRLKYELKEIEAILTGKVTKEEAIEKVPALKAHENWIEELREKFSLPLKEEEARALLREEVGLKFMEVLECAGVFKQNEVGISAFDKFIRICCEDNN